MSMTSDRYCPRPQSATLINSQHRARSTHLSSLRFTLISRGRAVEPALSSKHSELIDLHNQHSTNNFVNHLHIVHPSHRPYHTIQIIARLSTVAGSLLTKVRRHCTPYENGDYSITIHSHGRPARHRSGRSTTDSYTFKQEVRDREPA